MKDRLRTRQTRPKHPARAEGEPPVRILLVDDDEEDYLLTRELLADIPENRFQLDWIPDPDAASRRCAATSTTCS